MPTWSSHSNSHTAGRPAACLRPENRPTVVVAPRRVCSCLWHHLVNYSHPRSPLNEVAAAPTYRFMIRRNFSGSLTASEFSRVTLAVEIPIWLTPSALGCLGSGGIRHRRSVESEVARYRRSNCREVRRRRPNFGIVVADRQTRPRHATIDCKLATLGLYSGNA